MVDKQFVDKVMFDVFFECSELREAGQREYAGAEKPFGNFERLAEELSSVSESLTRELILWVYAKKHEDGIRSYLNGHKSQREDVRGRINDFIVYMILLRAMIEEDIQNVESS